MEVAHTFSLKELDERRMQLTFKLQAAREVKETVERSGRVTPEALAAIEAYRTDVVGQMGLVDQQRKKAIEDARYLEDFEPPPPRDNEEFLEEVRHSLRNWKRTKRIKASCDYRDGYVDGLIEVVGIVLDMDDDSVRKMLERHLPPSPR
jgi:hypothetical protein